MKKVVSMAQSQEIITKDSSQQLLESSIEVLRTIFIENAVQKNSDIGQKIFKVIENMETAQALISKSDTPRSRSSTVSSTGSLDDFVHSYDKQNFLYTYTWLPRGEFNGWKKGNDFRTWVESGFKLPKPQTELNCWEAVIVILYLYNAISTRTIESVYNAKADNTGDTNAFSTLLGLEDPSCSKKVAFANLESNVEAGDILVFHSNQGTIGHVALVLENLEKIWLISHWTLPKEKMIRITPHRVLTVSEKSANSNCLKGISKKETILRKLQTVFDLFLKPELDTAKILVAAQEYFKIQQSSFSATDALLQSNLIGRCKSDQEELNNYTIPSEIGSAIAVLYKTTFQLLTQAEKVLTKIKEQEELVNIMYSCLDYLWQIVPLHGPVTELEYLVKDTVTISTEFREHFKEFQRQ